MSAVELTDVGSVRQFMQKSVSDKLQDEDLEVLILQASQEIQRHCNREFVPSGSEKRSFEFEPNGGLELVDLKPYELRSVSLVTVDPEFSGGQPVTDYRLWPYPSRDGTFFGLRLAELPEVSLPSGFPGSPELPYQTRRLDVTGTWGMTEVPLAVQHWANVTVEAWAHLRRLGAQPTEGQFAEGALPLSYDLPLPVVWGLKRWVRPTPAV